MNFIKDFVSGIPFVGDIADAVIGGWQDSRNARREIDAQKEFAQHGVRWRVEDAQRAGVHPLFALGSNPGASYTPNPVMGRDPGFSEAGQAIGDATERAGRAPREEEMHRATIRATNAAAARDEAQAAYWASEAKRGEQETSKPGPWADQYGVNPATGVPESVVKKSDAVLARNVTNPSSSAGDHPFWKLYTIGDRGQTHEVDGQRFRKPGKSMQIYLPFSEEGPSEAMSEIPLWFMPILLKYNMEMLGGRFAEDFARMFPGGQSIWNMIDNFP